MILTTGKWAHFDPDRVNFIPLLSRPIKFNPETGVQGDRLSKPEPGWVEKDIADNRINANGQKLTQVLAIEF